MARLARRMARGRLRVSVQGFLRAADLRRLERACSPALERRPAPLDLNVDALRGLDEPARQFVRSLLHRGAALSGDAAPRWQEIVNGRPEANS